MKAYLDNIKMRNRKLNDFNNLTSLLYKNNENALQDNITNEQERKVLKDIYHYYLNKKDDIKKINTI